MRIRLTDLSYDDNKITAKELSVELISVNESTGVRVAEVGIDIINRYGLELDNCMGHGYDNGCQ